MDISILFFIIIFVFIASYLPGRFIAQLLPLNQDERIVISFGTSLFIYYLIGFSSYIFNIPFIILPSFIILNILSLLGLLLFPRFILEPISKPSQTPCEWVTRNGEPHCRGPLWGIQWGSPLRRPLKVCRAAGPKEKKVLIPVLKPTSSLL